MDDLESTLEQLALDHTDIGSDWTGIRYCYIQDTDGNQIELHEEMSSEIDNKVFNFAYKMAFRDATMRNAFQRWEGEDDSSFHERKQNISKKSKDAVKEYVDNILDNKYPEPIDIICKIIDEGNGFRYGNAQKLVNMTAKYMFMSAYADGNKRACFKNCHCPMDSVMLRVVKDKYPGASLNIDFVWSRMTGAKDNIPNEYREFQEKVGEIAAEDQIMPIEVDFKYWDE